MRCTAFLDGYTDFKDGRLSPARDVVFRDHMNGCPDCRRYDRVVRSGLQLLSDIPAPESSADFMPRLQHRLYNLDQGVPDMSSRRFLGSAALVAVASVGVLALFWLPFAASVPVELELAPVAVERPPEQLVTNSNQVPLLLRSGPFVQPVGLLDERGPDSFLDGERQWYPAPQPDPKAFITADRR